MEELVRELRTESIAAARRASVWTRERRAAAAAGRHSIEEAAAAAAEAGDGGDGGGAGGLSRAALFHSRHTHGFPAAAADGQLLVGEPPAATSAHLQSNFLDRMSLPLRQQPLQNCRGWCGDQPPSSRPQPRRKQQWRQQQQHQLRRRQRRQHQHDSGEEDRSFDRMAPLNRWRYDEVAAVDRDGVLEKAAAVYGSDDSDVNDEEEEEDEEDEEEEEEEEEDAESDDDEDEHEQTDESDDSLETTDSEGHSSSDGGDPHHVRVEMMMMRRRRRPKDTAWARHKAQLAAHGGTAMGLLRARKLDPHSSGGGRPATADGGTFLGSSCSSSRSLFPSAASHPPPPAAFFTPPPREPLDERPPARSPACLCFCLCLPCQPASQPRASSLSQFNHSHTI
jgi:hypothetical protein